MPVKSGKCWTLTKRHTRATINKVLAANRVPIGDDESDDDDDDGGDDGDDDYDDHCDGEVNDYFADNFVDHYCNPMLV